MRVTDLDKFSLEQIWRPYQTLCGLPNRPEKSAPFSLEETAKRLMENSEWSDAVLNRLKAIGIIFPRYIQHPLTDYLRQNPKDAAGLMKVCGWKSVTMVQRYAHIDLDDIKPRVSNIWGNNGDAPKTKSRKPKADKVIPLKS